MAVEIKSLIHYPDVYFKKYTAIVNNGFEIMDEERKQHMIGTFQGFDASNVSELRVLAIGTANGWVDEIIIDVLSKKFPKISYVVVEPDKDELQKFKDRETSKTTQGQWQNVNIEFNLSTIEEYLEKRNSADTKEFFHIIHAIQCPYYFTDPHKSLYDLYQVLERGGLLLIVMLKGPWEKTLEKIGEYYYDKKFHFIGVTAVRKNLEERIPNMKIETKYRKKNIVVTECFKEDSADGNDILDCITQILDFRKTVPKHVYDDIMQVFNEHCHQSGDDILFGADEEDLIILKE
ncbi:histamine N-methyltransferase-like [Glandiceps talaboti]